mgnify:CR=1 FL=1
MQKFKSMVQAFNCGFSEGYGNDFDISKLRYDKIIIMPMPMSMVSISVRF